MTIILQLFQKIEEKGTFPNSCYARPGSASSQKQTPQKKKKRDKPTLCMSVDAKHFNENLAD